MTEKGILVCVPADWPTTVPNSIFNRQCSRCQRFVMIAPSGQKVLAQMDLLVVCVPCAELPGGLPDEAEHLIAGRPDEIAAEFRSKIPNPHRKRN